MVSGVCHDNRMYDMTVRVEKGWFVKACLCLLLFAFGLPNIAVAANKEPQPAYFAIIDHETIPVATFASVFTQAVRDTFYHGKIPKAKIDAYRKKIANELVNDILLEKEAKRRHIKINVGLIDKKIAKIDKKNSAKPGWKKRRKEVLALVRSQLVRQRYVRSLEKHVRKVADPDYAQLNEYYKKHIDKFTAPQQWHVSIIMLKVDPSSTDEQWSKTTDMATDLVAQIRKGGNFAELARINSGDKSAENGGDMGYLHIGMLAKPAQAILNSMKPGEVSDPVVLLQGVAIFRLDGIRPAKINPLSKVKKRVKQLWRREAGEKAWSGLIHRLRSRANVTFGSPMFEKK